MRASLQDCVPLVHNASQGTCAFRNDPGENEAGGRDEKLNFSTAVESARAFCRVIK